MNNAEQIRFTRDLIKAVQAKLLAHSDNIPATWDGHELREWIADAFDNERVCTDARRLREYRNEILIRNL